MVQPSGAERAAASAARLPLAPPLFSITTCWPHVSERRAETMRAIASAPPPGGNGTIRRTNRFGQFRTDKACSDEGCADIRPARLGGSAAAAGDAIAGRGGVICWPLCWAPWLRAAPPPPRPARAPPRGWAEEP